MFPHVITSAEPTDIVYIASPKGGFHGNYGNPPGSATDKNQNYEMKLG